MVVWTGDFDTSSSITTIFSNRWRCLCILAACLYQGVRVSKPRKRTREKQGKFAIAQAKLIGSSLFSSVRRTTVRRATVIPSAVRFFVPAFTQRIGRSVFASRRWFNNKRPTTWCVPLVPPSRNTTTKVEEWVKVGNWKSFTGALGLYGITLLILKVLKIVSKIRTICRDAWGTKVRQSFSFKPCNISLAKFSKRGLVMRPVVSSSTRQSTDVKDCVNNEESWVMNSKWRFLFWCKIYCSLEISLDYRGSPR